MGNSGDKKSLAIIGTGIAGMACGYYLQQRFDITVYEKNDYIGGHTHTVTVQEGNRDVPIDTGFIVYNEINYPLLSNLFAELGVVTQPAKMSFSVQYRPEKLEFCGTGWAGLFAQQKNLFKPSFWRLLKDINRFNKESVEILDDARYQDVTLEEYAREKGFSGQFLEKYLIPMSSAVWSTTPDAMLNFPATALIRFFKNHAFLGLHGQHAWRTVTGGSWRYRDKLVAGFRDRIQTSTPALKVERVGQRARVTNAQGVPQEFDAVILATHADEALGLLDQPTASEQQLLGVFKYQKNMAVLHSDRSVMPETRRAWSSWNYCYRKDGQGAAHASTSYWMNELQGVSDGEQYFLSINDSERIPERYKKREIVYMHPIFSVQAMRAQRQLASLNVLGPIFYCGSYFRYGFHEDALMSALDVVKRLL